MSFSTSILRSIINERETSLGLTRSQKQWAIGKKEMNYDHKMETRL